MAKFIRSIGNARINNYGFDLYEEKDGSATIRPQKLNKSLPKKHWLTFESLETAEKAIVRAAGKDSEGAQRVFRLIQAWL